jgi:hypothetical protein
MSPRDDRIAVPAEARAGPDVDDHEPRFLNSLVNPRAWMARVPRTDGRTEQAGQRLPAFAHSATRRQVPALPECAGMSLEQRVLTRRVEEVAQRPREVGRNRRLVVFAGKDLVLDFEIGIRATA